MGLPVRYIKRAHKAWTICVVKVSRQTGSIDLYKGSRREAEKWGKIEKVLFFFFFSAPANTKNLKCRAFIQ